MAALLVDLRDLKTYDSFENVITGETSGSRR